MNKDYKRLTERKGEDIAIDLNACGITNIKDFAHDKLIKEIATHLAELEDKIENGTLVEIKTIAKIMNNTFGCPCEYGLDVYAVSQYDDWCEKSCGGVCDADNYTACWETYLTTKLRELKGERE